jgi:cell division protein FtsL
LAAVPAERDPYLLRNLPHDDVIFWGKKIDNSHLVRQTDPRGGRPCWNVIATAGVILALLLGVLAPSVANRVAGYQLEALRVEAQNLADERRTLELQEAQLLSPARLQQLAQKQNLATPTPNQVSRLETKGESKVAMVKK